MGTMAIPDHTGHRAVSWTDGDHRSVREAENLFISLREQRLVPFARSGTDTFEQIRTFDPSVDEVMWVRPLQGG